MTQTANLNGGPGASFTVQKTGEVLGGSEVVVGQALPDFRFFPYISRDYESQAQPDLLAFDVLLIAAPARIFVSLF